MRIRVLLWLLIACCGMAIFSQVDEISSDYFECCAGNFGEFLYYCKYGQMFLSIVFCKVVLVIVYVLLTVLHCTELCYFCHVIKGRVVF